MKILVLAPHPFYQERGTPIDVLLVLRVLTERKDTKVDLLVYSEGENIELENLTIHRCKSLRYTKNIRPGFSSKKLICDVQMFFKAWSLVRKNSYSVIHAGEESVFFAIFFKVFYKIPYAYDLDSSIAQQLVEKKPFLKILSPLLNGLEKLAIRSSLINFPVCKALEDLCQKNCSRKTVTLHDISQLKNPKAQGSGWLKTDLGINRMILLYIGNLEIYQGIDLLLDSFHIAAKETKQIDLVIIGGVDEDIQIYKRKAKDLNISDRTHFLGPKPFDKLHEYLAEADILVCPRIRGVNTPMKIFPYLHSGKPVLATDLYTHNQLLTKKETYLASANPQDFSKAIRDLAVNKELRIGLGKAGYEFVEKNHNFKAHRDRLMNAYDWIEKNLNEPRAN